MNSFRLYREIVNNNNKNDSHNSIEDKQQVLLNGIWYAVCLMAPLALDSFQIEFRLMNVSCSDVHLIEMLDISNERINGFECD